jgi:hypothetical protein
VQSFPKFREDCGSAQSEPISRRVSISHKHRECDIFCEENKGGSHEDRLCASVDRGSTVDATWTHKTKLNGFRLEVIRDGADTILYSRNANIVMTTFLVWLRPRAALPQD